MFEITQNEMIDVKKGLYMGIGVDIRAEEKKTTPLYLDWKSLNAHLGVQGTTRTGKTVLMLNIARQVIQKGDNLFIIDPKGGKGQEIVTTVIEEAIANDRGKEIVYISGVHESLSDRINPIYGWNNTSIASLVKKFTESPGSDQFFSDIVYKIIFAVSSGIEAIEAIQLLYNPQYNDILLEAEIRKYKEFMLTKGLARDIFSKKKEIFNPDSIAVAKHKNTKSYNPTTAKFSLSNSGLNKVEYVYTRKFLTFRDLYHFSTKDKIEDLYNDLKDMFVTEKGDIRSDLPLKVKEKGIEALNLLQELFNKEKAFFEKIGESLSTILVQLTTGEIGRILNDIRINPLVLKLREKDERVICIIQPFPMLQKTASDMLVKIYISMLEYLMGIVGATGEELNSRIHLMIDEAASVVYPGIDSLFNKAGGLGTSLYVFTQSFADWEKALGEVEAKIVMDNINTHFRLRMNDPSSCEIVAKEFGTIKKLESSSMLSEDNIRYVSQKTEEFLLPPEYVRRLPVGRAVAKVDDKVYIVDLPYFSGTKGSIKMPTLFKSKKEAELLLA